MTFSIFLFFSALLLSFRLSDLFSFLFCTLCNHFDSLSKIGLEFGLSARIAVF